MKTNSLLKSLRQEIDLTKNDNYSDDTTENLLFDDTKALTGYDYEQNDEDAEYILKATNTERLQYLLHCVWLPFTFSQKLKKCIGEKKFTEMVKNHIEGEIVNTTYCLSHDYCDANVVMASAFRKVIGRPVKMNRDEDLAIWNKAWERAKQNNFFVPPIKTISFTPEAITNNWDGDTEVSPVFDNGAFAEVCEPGKETYWSVYLHQKTGGVQCIADFPTQELANDFNDILKRLWLLRKL